MLLERARSQLVVIDLQDKLLPAIADGEAVVERARLLIEAAERLDVPVSVTEQNVEGLGATVADLDEALHDAPRFAKMSFSAARDSAFRDHVGGIARAGRDQLVVIGTESHVCVLQTALGFRAEGRAVYVVADAIGSRRKKSRRLALARMAAAGVRIVNAEMVVFEWLERAGTDAFRELLTLIK